jgi:diguanylate cyclase (GGDEF)-like protein
MPQVGPQGENAMDAVSENRRLRQLLQELADTASHNEAVYERCYARELELLEAADLGVLLQRLTAELHDTFDVQAVRLLLADPEHQLAGLLNDLGINPRQFPELRLLEDTEIACGRLARQRSPWLGAWQQQLHGRLLPQRGLRSLAYLPLQRGEIQGALALGSSDPKRFTSEHATDFLNRFAVVAALCLENGINRERLRLSGLTDGLTGLYNRRYLEMRLAAEVARARRHEQALSCLFLDADHFKQVNDRHGHAVGDLALVTLAGSIRRQLRAGDLATRYGGEEIAVLLPHTELRDAALLAERIRSRIAASPLRLPGGEQLPLTVSIGVAELQEDPNQDHRALAARLLDQADQALYRAKQAGRNRVTCATPR